MIKVEACRGCGRSLFIHPIANLVVRLEMEPLDAAQATQALLGGRNLWRVTATSVTGVRPAELTALAQRGVTEGPHVCQEHRCRSDARQSGCTAVSRPNPTPAVPAPQPTPHRPPAGRATRSSGPSAAPSSARAAGPRRSDPVCDGCGKPCADGTYAAIELGELTIWAQHILQCE